MVFAVIICLIFTYSINASTKNCYYLNDNGVCFQEDEFYFLSNMYWNGIQKVFTQSDYDKIIKRHKHAGEVISSYDNNFEVKSSSYSDGKKNIKLSKSCSSNYCIVSTTVDWSINPTVRSYDVIGAYLENVSLYDVLSTIIVVNNSTQNNFNNVKYDNNGFGVSVLLPFGNGSIKISQTYKTGKGGTIYSSYQHANKNISQIDSYSYSISKLGYGNVFNFFGSSINVYDKMNGVSINV